MCSMVPLLMGWIMVRAVLNASRNLVSRMKREVAAEVLWLEAKQGSQEESKSLFWIAGWGLISGGLGWVGTDGSVVSLCPLP